MGCTHRPGTKEEWHLKILYGLQKAQFDYPQGCLPSTPHRGVLELLEESCLVFYPGPRIGLLAG